VALPIDQFTQQIISFPLRSIPTSNTSATIAMTHVYDTGLSQDFRSILHKLSTFPRASYIQLLSQVICTVRICHCDSQATIGVFESDAALLTGGLITAISTDVTMQGAIFNGTYTLGAPFPFVCTSGNLEWWAMLQSGQYRATLALR
jgi:hypothetical protein